MHEQSVQDGGAGGERCEDREGTHKKGPGGAFRISGEQDQRMASTSFSIFSGVSIEP